MNTVTAAAQKIQATDYEIERTKNKIKTINEQMMEVLEGMDEYDEVVNLEGQLAVAREKLKLALRSNSEYMGYTEEKAELSEKMAGLKHILSEILVAYFAQTKERQVELNAHGDGRAVIVTGKLGKAQKYQPGLFVDPLEDLVELAEKNDIDMEVSLTHKDTGTRIDKDGIHTKK